MEERIRALEERIRPFLKFERSASRREILCDLIALRDILAQTESGTHIDWTQIELGIDRTQIDWRIKLRETLRSWSGCQGGKDSVTMEKLRKTARSILKMPVLRECRPLENSSSKELSLSVKASLNEDVARSTSPSSSSDDESTENEQPELKRRKSEHKEAEALDMDKIHDRMAIKAIKCERLPSEYFPHPMPLRYMCRRPELRWQWKERWSTYRQDLIGGGSNSDLDSF